MNEFECHDETRPFLIKLAVKNETWIYVRARFKPKMANG